MSELQQELLEMMLEEGLPLAEMEYRFAPPRLWKFDLAYPDRKLAIEIEGGTWVRGRHITPSGYARDCEKYSIAALLGWTVVRVTSDMVHNKKAIKLVQIALGLKPELMDEFVHKERAPRKKRVDRLPKKKRGKKIDGLKLFRKSR